MQRVTGKGCHGQFPFPQMTDMAPSTDADRSVNADRKPIRNNHGTMKKKPLIATAAGVALLATALVSRAENPYYDPTRPHHRPDGFTNTDGKRIDKSPAQLWRWIRENLGSGLPKPPQTHVQGYNGFEVLKPDTAWLTDNREQVSFTWLGHASILLQSGGLNILLDPILSQRASPVQWAGPKRKVPPPLTMEQLPPIDAVLISHNHYDHMDADTLLGIAQRFPSAQFIVPLGNERWFQRQGITQVKGLDWWESVTIGTTSFHCLPARHWSVRNFADRNENLWSGWAVVNDAHRFFFAGDTGYSDDFKAIGERLGPFDLTALPVGAYAPRWFMQDQHIGPEEAVRIHRELKARQSIGVHWGTFELSLESLDEPIGAVRHAAEKAGLADNEFRMIRHGETIRY